MWTRQKLRIRTRREQLKISVQFPTQMCLAKNLQLSQSAVWPPEAGWALGSACFWGTEGKLRGQPSKQDFGEE